MIQEDKQLLLKDLCARLPYGVKVGFNKEGDVFTPIKFDLQTKELFAEDKNNNCICIFRYDIFKPYLRPMSSMTDEERTKIAVLSKFNGLTKSADFAECSSIVVDYCNSRHLDYRDLISMGLALEAPEGIY